MKINSADEKMKKTENEQKPLIRIAYESRIFLAPAQLLPFKTFTYNRLLIFCRNVFSLSAGHVSPSPSAYLNLHLFCA